MMMMMMMMMMMLYSYDSTRVQHAQLQAGTACIV
jgi:hypothetical protein